MNKQLLKASFKKGFIFAIIMIFVMMIGFHLIAAGLLSRFFGVNVLRGGVPEVRFMTYIHIIFALLTGWVASDRKQDLKTRLLQGALTSLASGLFIALFDLLLNFLVTAQIDVRTYLTALSIDSMDYFLLRMGSRGILVHLAIYFLVGSAATALAILVDSEKVQKVWHAINASVRGFIQKINSLVPPVARKILLFALYAGVLALIIILPTKWGSYVNFVVGIVGLYVIAGIGLNIIVGLSGQLMLGYAAFFAMGAYSVALLNSPYPHNILIGFWPSIIIGMMLAVVAAAVLGLPILHLRGDYLAIVTLGFGEIIRILLKSDLLTDFTGGPRGIHAIEGPTLFGKPFNTDVDYVYIILVGVAISIFIFNRLQNSNTGRAWLAIKEDAIAAQATGINLQKYKLLALLIGAAFAGLVGGISAARNQFTGPNDHSLMVSINVLSIIIVGGMNSIPGIILGAFTLKGLPEILREVENYRQLAFGALLVIMMIARPSGLWPSTRPKHEKDLENGITAGKQKEESGRKNA
jgi:branched-chain amino acid transport system permease protein